MSRNVNFKMYNLSGWLSVCENTFDTVQIKTQILTNLGVNLVETNYTYKSRTSSGSANRKPRLEGRQKNQTDHWIHHFLTNLVSSNFCYSFLSPYRLNALCTRSVFVIDSTWVFWNFIFDSLWPNWINHVTN